MIVGGVSEPIGNVNNPVGGLPASTSPPAPPVIRAVLTLPRQHLLRGTLR